ncbi:LysR family transcriptional regulator [Actinokineospora sp. NPDC004072]
MGLELRHLRSVCAIADAGSLTRAATVLGVSQPVLSARLQRVEREVGGRLFDRGRGGVTPTPLGQFLLTRARGVLLAVEELRRATGRQVCADRPQVRLGGVSCAVSIGLADRLSDLLPDVEVRLHGDYSPRALWELLLADRLDAAAVVDYPGFPLNTPSTVLADVIAVEPVFVAMSDRHPLADRAEVDLAELAGERWAVTPQDGAGWPDCFYAACHRAGFTPRVLYSVSDAVPQHDIVATRRAVSPCQAVFPTGDGVVVKPLAGTPVHMRHLLVCRAEGLLADGFADLLRLARDAYHAAAGRHEHYRAWLGQTS